MPIYTSDCLDILPTLPAESVQCAVTSPPYYGLRDYGVDGQIGLEKSLEEYVEKLVAVFRDVRRVLRADGTVWLNLGDSYASDTKGSGGTNPNKRTITGGHRTIEEGQYFGVRKINHGLKPKDLIGIPWHVAFALQADGWWLRQDIIWAKRNPMPESVRDRCTKAHEYIFLMTKNARYFYDAEAVREPIKDNSGQNMRAPKLGNHRADGNYDTVTAKTYSEIKGANRRSVWTITTKPFKEAHFATFPPEIPEVCIKAGTSEKGCCPKCGSPWERVVEKTGNRIQHQWASGTDAKTEIAKGKHGSTSTLITGFSQEYHTTGWRPTCNHNLNPVPCTVLDPFSGAGTTGLVAERLGRKYIGIELNPSYVKMSEKRIYDAQISDMEIFYD